MARQAVRAEPELASEQPELLIWVHGLEPCLLAWFEELFPSFAAFDQLIEHGPVMAWVVHYTSLR